jgi:uncharacterized membrane protein
MLKKKPQLTEIEKTAETQRKEELLRSRRTLFFLTLVIWAIVFLFLRDALKIGGSPVFNFILLIALLFLVFLFVRVGAIKFKQWWYNLKRTVKNLFKRN